MFVGVPIFEQLGANPPSFTDYPLMLISHGCEVDKTKVDVLLVSRVRLIASISPGDTKPVRDGKVRSTMYLGDVPSLGEAFADFRYMHRILRADLDAAADTGRKIASMTPDGRVVLQVHLFRFHSRRLPGDPLPANRDDW